MSRLSSPLGRALLLFGGGLLCLAVTPPLQVPDAPAHYLRAFQVSELALVGEKRDGKTGSELPAAAEFDRRQYADLPFHPERTISPAQWRERWERSPCLTPAALADREFPQLSMIGMYSPVTYLPQALAIRLAVLLETRSLAAVYLAGLAALLANTLLLFLAFRALDFSRRAAGFCFLLAGMPMSLFLIGSLSADGTTICLAILTFALALRLRGKFTPGIFRALVAAALLLGLCKSLYFLVALAAVPVALPGLLNSEGRRERLGRAALLAAAAVVPALLWGLANRGLWTPLREGHIDPGAQLAFVTGHPGKILGMLGREALLQHRAVLETFVGKLGWLDTPLPGWLVNLYAVLLLASLATGFAGDREALPPDAFGWIATAGLALAFVLGLAIGTYLTWNEVGAEGLAGLQGRYFIPLAPLALALVPPGIRLAAVRERLHGAVLLGAWALSTAVLASTLVSRYWISGG